MTFGLAANVAVGVGGGGGGGGVALATFLLQAANTSIVDSAAIKENIFNFLRIMSSSEVTCNFSRITGLRF